MSHKRCVALGLLLMLGWGVPRAEAEHREQRQTTWEGLSIIRGQTVRIAMPDGARIVGRATALEVDALAVEIRKTSNKAAYPKGRFLVPRATLKAVEVEHPTIRWRIVGIAVGGSLGAFLAILANGLASSGLQTRHPVVAAATAGAVCLPVGGYLLGWAADRRTITYVIKP
jgi:hypothetical protein